MSRRRNPRAHNAGDKTRVPMSKLPAPKGIPPVSTSIVDRSGNCSNVASPWPTSNAVKRSAELCSIGGRCGGGGCSSSSISNSSGSSRRSSSSSSLSILWLSLSLSLARSFPSLFVRLLARSLAWHQQASKGRSLGVTTAASGCLFACYSAHHNASRKSQSH